MCCTYLQVLLHVLLLLNVDTTGSTDNKPISKFISNAPQHVAVHRVDCSCYLIFQNNSWKILQKTRWGGSMPNSILKVR